MPNYKSDNLPFTPSARLLLLLGDELIRDARYAAFELVKNAYDADAENVIVQMRNVTSQIEGKIIVEDDGHGMDWETIEKVWLVPGTGYRSSQTSKGERTPKFNRRPLGAKGVGRFASHKLGRKIQLITKKESCPEIVVDVDWKDFNADRKLSEVLISIEEREPQCFVNDQTGTKIEISSLRTEWTRGDVRQFHREVMSISSPFGGPSEFQTLVEIEPEKWWLNDLTDLSNIWKSALYSAFCVISNGCYSYDYTMRDFPLLSRKVSSRSLTETTALPFKKDPEDKSVLQEDDTLYESERTILDQLGDIQLNLHIFDLDNEVIRLAEINDKKGIIGLLREHGGIRVYRDGMRVYGYGESNNDWLRLGDRRVSLPTKRLSNNQIIGAVSLDAESSSDLVEKTNREGFVEDKCFKVFRKAVLEVLCQIESERNVDKERIRIATNIKTLKEPVLAELSELRLKVGKCSPEIQKELNPFILRAEKQFLEMREMMLTAAGTGLSLGVVIHEVEKRIAELTKALDAQANIGEIKSLAKGLSELVDSFTYLMRQSPSKVETPDALVANAIANCKHRFKYHNIIIENGFEKSKSSFKIKCTRRLIISTIMNLIDNSLYWLNIKSPNEKRIYIGPCYDYSEGKGIIIADNGPGFTDPPEIMVKPFLSRKREGMGLGLYLAEEIMKLHIGRLVFPEKNDIELSQRFDGAVVVMLFKEEQ